MFPFPDKTEGVPLLQWWFGFHVNLQRGALPTTLHGRWEGSVNGTKSSEGVLEASMLVWGRGSSTLMVCWVPCESIAGHLPPTTVAFVGGHLKIKFLF